ncbi:hypothetical protein PCCS19_46200 [Paenibacillus sp. CCS19]|nr:hypothetical protein PCCS19_46200 [Paenibacillus cellulosilyticus]
MGLGYEADGCAGRIPELKPNVRIMISRSLFFGSGVRLFGHACEKYGFSANIQFPSKVGLRFG